MSFKKKAAIAPSGGPAAVRFSWSSSGSGFDEDDAELVGRELLKIAESNRIDVASLDPKEVFEIVFNDPRHPLRRVFGDFEDTDGAAKKHWISLTRTMIRSIRVQIISLPGRKIEPVQALFIAAEATVRNGRGTTVKRRRVLATDLADNDPAFISALGLRIRQIANAIAGLEGVTAFSDKVPAEVVRLRDALRRVMNEYDQAIATVAAE